MISVTLDTDVWISGLLWPGEASRIIGLAEDGRILPFITKEILAEVFNVLQREEKFNDLLDKRDILLIPVIEKIIKLSGEAGVKERINEIKDDPDDNKILECAVNSGSLFVVTYDNHLLKLREYRGIKILAPGFLKAEKGA